MPPHELTASVIRFFASLTVIRVGRRLFRGRDQSQGRADAIYGTNAVYRSPFTVRSLGSGFAVNGRAACGLPQSIANGEP